MKKRTPKNETWYKEYKNLSETIKRKSKTYYYSDQFMKYKDNIEKTREVRKIIGKTEIRNSNLHEKLIVKRKRLLTKRK